jgi:hypothetical protein
MTHEFADNAPLSAPMSNKCDNRIDLLLESEKGML